MNAFRFRRAAIAVTAAAVLPLTLTACGGDDSSSDTAADKSSSSAPADEKSSPAADGAAVADGPFGPACASVPQDGAGSFDGMAQDPVATAASNNQALSTLVTAVKKAGLVDTLNNAQNITVFAPTNDAFAKIPKADLDKVLADKEMLTNILTYHVVGEKLSPSSWRAEPTTPSRSPPSPPRAPARTTPSTTLPRSSAATSPPPTPPSTSSTRS